MTSKTEQFYIRHIAELEEQLKQRDERIAVLEKQVAELIKVNAGLTDKVAKLSKNSSNSSKPPSWGVKIRFNSYKVDSFFKDLHANPLSLTL